MSQLRLQKSLQQTPIVVDQQQGGFFTRFKQKAQQAKTKVIATKNKLFGLSTNAKNNAINQASDLNDLQTILKGLGARETEVSKIITDVKSQAEESISKCLNEHITKYNDLPSETDIYKLLQGCTLDYGKKYLQVKLNDLSKKVEDEIEMQLICILGNNNRLPLFNEINLRSLYPTQLAEAIYSKKLELHLDLFYQNLTYGSQKLYKTATSLPNDIIDSLLRCVDYMRCVSVIPSAETASDSTITEIIREYTRLSSSFIPGLVDTYLANQSNLEAFIQQELEESHFSDSNLAKCAHLQTIYILTMQIAMLIDLSYALKLKLNAETICRITTAILVVTLQILHNECPILKIPKKIYCGYVGLGDLICDTPHDIRRILPRWIRDIFGKLKETNLLKEHRVTWHKELGTLTYQRMLGINGAMNMMYCFRAGNAFVKADKLTSIEQCSEIFGALSPIPVKSEKELILKLYKEDLYKDI